MPKHTATRTAFTAPSLQITFLAASKTLRQSYRGAGILKCASIRTLICGGAVIATMCTSETAWAEEPAFNVRVGAVFANVDTKIQVDPTQFEGNGARIDLESDLSLRKSTKIGFVEASYRVAPRWTVNLQYLRLSRSRSVSIDRDIEVGDTIYPVNADVTGVFRTTLYKAHVEYSFVKSDRAEAGISIGAHITDFRFSVEGQGTVAGAGGAVREERRDVLAPLPNVGVFGSFQVAKRLKLSARVNYFQLKAGSVDGGLTDIETSIAYQPTKNFAIGAGYRSLGYRLDANRENFEGSIRYKFKGPVLFATASF